MHYSFDFDFTLADSSRGAVECANFALRALGFPEGSPESIHRTVGLTLERTCSELTGSHDPVLAAEFKRHFVDRADQVMLEHIAFFDTTPAALSQLKSLGHYVSVVSTKYHARIDAALHRDGLRGYVDYIVGGDEVRQNKPDPEGLLRAIERSGVEKSSTLYVGDSQTDGECAQRAGVGFVAVTTGATSAGDLAKWGPRFVCTSLSELI